MADLVGARLGLLFGDVSADRVGHLFLDHAAFVTHAVDGLFYDFGDPDLFAHLARRALHLADPNLAGHVHATAGAGIPSPAARLANALANDRPGDFADLSFPTSAANLNGLGVVHGLADDLADFLHARLVDRLADVVANRPRLGLPDGLADRVVAGPVVGLVDGLADRVADFLLPRLPDGLADRVVARPVASLVDRFADRVADLLLPGLPDGLTDRVVARPVTSLVDRLADRVGALAVASLGHVLGARDLLVFVDGIVNRLVTRVLLFFVHHLAASLHDGVTLLLRTAVVGLLHAAATRLVARSAAIGRRCRAGRGGNKQQSGQCACNGLHFHLLG